MIVILYSYVRIEMLPGLHIPPSLPPPKRRQSTRVSHSGENSIRAECCDLPGGRRRRGRSGAQKLGLFQRVSQDVFRPSVITNTYTNAIIIIQGGPDPAPGGRAGQKRGSVTLSKFRSHWIQRERFCLKNSSLLALQSRWDVMKDRGPPAGRTYHI